ncbi:MAG TPA: hypothetical protein VFL69_00975 [Marmoricola sp.]|nr:hypothetical protein [Marmoricola sp.]
MTSTAFAPPAAPVAARPTTRFRRVAGATTLIAAPWLFVAANGTYAWMTRHGGDDYTGAHALKLAASGSPALFQTILVCAMLACLLIIPGLLAGTRMLRASAPRLSLFAGLSMIGGYVCYFGVIPQSYVTLAMVEQGGDLRDYAAVLDASQSYASGVWVFLVFVFGNLVGTLLFGIAMLRSRSVVPAWAGLAVICWPVLHVTGMVIGSEWWEVTGGVLQALGFAALAAAVLRMPDAEWDHAA